MTREEAIELIESARKTMYLPKSKEYISDFGYALEMAIKALEQEPCEDVISRETVKIKYKRRLESSLKDESRGLDLTHLADCTRFNEFIDSIPPVTPQPKTGHCRDCKWWKDSDGAFRRGIEAESQCPMNRIEVYEGNGYCYLFEPQERSEV